MVGGVVVVVLVAGSSGLFEVVDDGGDERGECVGGETERAAGLFVEAAVVFDHGVDSFDGVASGVVGGPVGGSVGVALLVVELFDAEGDHSVAAVLGVGDGDGGLVRVVGAVGPVGVAGFGGGHNAARALGADEFLFSVGEVLDDPSIGIWPVRCTSLGGGRRLGRRVESMWWCPGGQGGAAVYEEGGVVFACGDQPDAFLFVGGLVHDDLPALFA